MSDIIDAVADGDLDKVEQLLSTGCDPNVQNHNGMTPLMMAFFKGHVEIAELLIPLSDLDLADSSGTKALDWAACIPELVGVVAAAGGRAGWVEAIDLPYDDPSFDKGTSKVLGRLRAKGQFVVPPDESVLAWIRDDMPPDLKALLHTWAHKPESSCLELRKGWSLERRAAGWCLDVVGGTLEDYETLGVDPRQTFVIGNDGGGTPLAATWMDGDTKMQLLALRLDEDLFTPLGTLHDIAK